MANLTEIAQWDAGIYRIETTDPVLGGENGIANAGIKQLANRTSYLKALVDAINGNYATQAYVAAQLAALVDSSPTALDTLNELAAALGDDPNFAATITASIAGKQPLDDTLTALAALATSADKLIYATGADAFALTTITAFGRSIISSASAADAKTALDISVGYMICSDEKPIGTNGGASIAGVQTRTINTVSANTIPGATLTSNQITLPAGTYRINARVPSYYANYNKAALHNLTDDIVSIPGSSEDADPGTSVSSKISGVITIAASKVFEVRQYIGQAIASYGLGLAANQAGVGVEIYTQIEIVKES